LPERFRYFCPHPNQAQFQFLEMELITRKSVLMVAGLAKPAGRRESGLFVAEGYKVIDELLLSGLDIVQLIVEKGKDIPRNWAQSDLTMVEASAADMKKMSAVTTPPGVMALARIPVVGKPEVPTPGKWMLALDGISDPGNLGTMIRTADWFGIHQIFCGEGTADCYASKVVQSAMGSLFRSKMYYGSLSGFIQKECIPASVPVVAADAGGDALNDMDSSHGGVLIIGSESHGVHPEIRKLATRVVAISKPSPSPAESLNAAVACGILMHQLTKK
jgi:RNA methyltransferase, TrmH family